MDGGIEPRELTDEDRVALGQRVREIRIQQGLRQSDLARIAGVSITTVFEVEKGGAARLSSIQKICSVGLAHPYESMVRWRKRHDNEGYMLYRTENATWIAPEDIRTMIPDDNAERIQDPAERRRLGRLGFVVTFYNLPDIRMVDGPGTFFLEIHGRRVSALNESTYQNCKLQCQSGSVRIMIGEQAVELNAGDIVACLGGDIRWIEPAKPLSHDESAPILLYMGAKSVGKAVHGGRRTLVRKEQKAKPD